MTGRKLKTDDPVVIVIKGRDGKSGHFEPSHSLNLTVFALGRTTGPAEGRFSGRPDLVREIASAATREVVVKKPSAQYCRLMVWAVSHLWRFLDTIDVQDNSIMTLSGLRHRWEDFVDWIERLAPDNAHAVYSHCRTILAPALLRADLESLSKNPFPSRRGVAKRRMVESPYTSVQEEQMAAAFRAARDRVLARIDAGHALADLGDPPRETLARHRENLGRSHNAVTFNEIWTPENTLRFVREEMLEDLPSFVEFEKRYGIRANRFELPPSVTVPRNLESEARGYGANPGIGRLYRALVPNTSDLIPFLAELAMLDGWNLQTAADPQRNNWCEKTADADTVTLFARKARAGGSYVQVSSETGPDSAFGILSAAIRITEPLHRHVLKQLEKSEATPQNGSAARERERLRWLSNRVWLGQRKSNASVVAALSAGKTTFWKECNDILARAAVTEEDGAPLQFKVHRARDGFAQDLYVTSSHNLAALQAGLSHATAQQSAEYLDQPAMRAIEQDEIGRIVDNLATRSPGAWPLHRAPLTTRPVGQGTFIVSRGGLDWLARADGLPSIGSLCTALRLTERPSGRRE